MTDDPLKPTAAVELKSRLDLELSPSEPLRSNIKSVEEATKLGTDQALVEFHGFTRDMAERLGEFVDGWFVGTNAHEGVRVYVEVGNGGAGEEQTDA